jgi:phosphoribosylanthranilate isomerase
VTGVKVKICGLTRQQDIRAAVAAGADILGFVFTESPRRIGVELARQLLDDVPPGTLRVGLFLDQAYDEVAGIVDSLSLDLLQFHGRESEAECSRYGLPWLKAVAMEGLDSAIRAEKNYPGAAGLLLDSHGQGQRGGTGKVFDWSMAKPLHKPIWLAGGLHAGNVATAIRTVRPYAVDVSSGVESAPGKKDAARMQAFIQAVRQVNLGNEQEHND